MRLWRAARQRLGFRRRSSTLLAIVASVAVAFSHSVAVADAAARGHGDGGDEACAASDASGVCRSQQDARETTGDLAGFQRLVAWMQEGMDAHLTAEELAALPRLAEALELKYAPNRGRYVATRKGLAPGEVLMRIPMQLLMHAGFFKNTSGSELVAALAEGLKGRELETFIAPQTWLALYLLEQRARGGASEWAPYMQILPAAFPTVPTAFGEEENRWLEGSRFLQRVARHRENLESQHTVILQLAPHLGERVTLEDYMWARSAISTRVFGWSLPGFERDETDFMVPLGDMFNHRSPKQVEWAFNATSRTLDYRALEAVPAGDEILISYGGKCNSQYLLHYGFTMPNVSSRWPPVSTVRVALGLDAAVPDRAVRERWLLKAKLRDEGEQLEPEEFELKANTWKNSGAESMLGYARLLSIPSGAEFDRRMKGKICRRFASPPRCDQPMGVDNEEAALSRCLAAVDAAISAYPTSLEDDEALLPTLAGLPLSLVTLRRDEKVVLRWWRRFFALALSGLRLPAEDFEREVLGTYEEFSPESQYLRVTLAALLSVERPSGDSAAR